MSPKEETQKHINRVGDLISYFEAHLKSRAYKHDASKLESPEAEGFEKVTEQLKSLTYGSEEYHQQLKEMKPFLDHHYANNRHHPEHFENGVDGMSLIDLVEMFCDWKAATERHDDGDLSKSITHNEQRFKLSPQLVSILKNTQKEMGW